jgi:hypothetical protein
LRVSSPAAGVLLDVFLGLEIEPGLIGQAGIVGGQNGEQFGFAGILGSKRGGVGVVGMLGGDDVEGDVRIPADEFVIQFAGVGIILAVAFVADLRVTQDIGEQHLGEEIGHLRVVNFGILDFYLDVLSVSVRNS